MKSSGQRTAVLVDAHPLWLEASEPVTRRSGGQVAGRTTDVDDALALVRQHGSGGAVAEVVGGGGARS